MWLHANIAEKNHQAREAHITVIIILLIVKGLFIIIQQLQIAKDALRNILIVIDALVLLVQDANGLEAI